MFTLIISVCLLVLTSVPLIKWYKKRAKFTRLINRIPGPKAYPLIGTMYLFFRTDRSKVWRVLKKNFENFPIISRTWVGPFARVELKRAEHIEKVLSSGKLHLEKAWTYNFLKQWLGEGLLTSAGQKWHSRRKILTPTFHFSILENFCEIFSEKSKILVDKLSEHADTGKAVNVYPYITRAALDIITDAAMGTQINAQEDIESEYVKSVYRTSELFVRRFFRPWLYPEFIFQRSADGLELLKHVEILHGFTNRVIQQRRKFRRDTVQSIVDNQIGKKNRQAFLDLLLDISEKENYLSDDDIREEVDTFMFEGHDTTTASISWTLYLLGLHPEIQEAVYQELDSLFHGSDRSATIPDFNEMKLLDRVIKESLRLYPSVPQVGRTLSEDVQLDEFTLPAGCAISIEMHNLHRDERYFPDAEAFDPDRFLPENTIGRHPFAYMPFSAGSRNCIGQKFAVYEEKSVLSAIIRNYRFKTIGKHEDVDKIFELILRPLNGIPLILEKRR